MPINGAILKTLSVVFTITIVTAPACGTYDIDTNDTLAPTQFVTSQSETLDKNNDYFVILIKEDGFYPDKIEIKPGDLVKWINESTRKSTVTSWHQYQSDAHVDYTEIGTVWDSGDIEPGGVFLKKFEEVGAFEYISLPIYFYVEFQDKIPGVVIVK